MLYSAALNFYNGIKTDWKYLSRRIRDHKRKISQSYGTIMFYDYLMKQYKEKNENINQGEYKTFENIKGFNYLEVIKEYIEKEVVISPLDFEKYSMDLDVEKEIKQKYSMTILLKEYKNGSLYADFDGREFIKPSEKIDRELSEYGITLAYIQKNL
ncbi:hypothetical protein CN906_20695 [Bacillus toyonensis]|nr:hypothetical protein CN906_20695 [Bacillus toyonensis]PGB31889.1 hypothetical protein COM16_17165 [Bacillus toyonensis]PHG54328.1 hypothetical protein COI57_01615 [Bacillus toyonensis]